MDVNILLSSKRLDETIFSSYQNLKCLHGYYHALGSSNSISLDFFHLGDL